MHPEDAEGIANNVDPDQTAPLGAVWSGSALFAQTCLSENLGTLRYKFISLDWPCQMKQFSYMYNLAEVKEKV